MNPYLWLDGLTGTAECALRGAESAAFLNRCAEAGVAVYAAAPDGDAEVRLTVPLRALERAEAIAKRSQCELDVLYRRGGAALGRRLLRRCVPALLLTALFLLLAWSRLYIWEIEVQGKERVPTGRIRSALSDCGVDLGSFWPGFTSDNLRSELLTRVPELAWATVNIYGSRAEVIVRERIPRPELIDADEPVDLVAERLGFVTKVEALSGAAAVRPGSAVAPGEVLIEGVSDSAFSGRRTLHALGKVIAETYYELSAAAPATERVRTGEGAHRSRWALLIGKKRVNFYRNASFCPPDCDKINTIWKCEIKGLFALPVALLRERVVECVCSEQSRDARTARRALEAQLHAQLENAVGDGGTIEQEHFSASVSDGRVAVCLRARCSENIAKEQKK